jgi:hypothetical protein
MHFPGRSFKKARSRAAASEGRLRYSKKEKRKRAKALFLVLFALFVAPLRSISSSSIRLRRRLLALLWAFFRLPLRLRRIEPVRFDEAVEVLQHQAWENAEWLAALRAFHPELQFVI